MKNNFKTASFTVFFPAFFQIQRLIFIHSFIKIHALGGLRYITLRKKLHYKKIVKLFFTEKFPLTFISIHYNFLFYSANLKINTARLNCQLLRTQFSIDPSNTNPIASFSKRTFLGFTIRCNRPCTWFTANRIMYLYYSTILFRTP